MMDEADRWIQGLKKCLPKAEKRLDVRPLLSDLRAKGILSDFEHEDVKRESINEIVRTRLVFYAVEKKDTEYIKKFVEILDVAVGSKQWADMIRREAEGACSLVIQP